MRKRDRVVMMVGWGVLKVVDGSKVFAYDPDDKMGGIDYLRLDKTKVRYLAKIKHPSFDMK